MIFNTLNNVKSLNQAELIFILFINILPPSDAYKYKLQIL